MTSRANAKQLVHIYRELADGPLSRKQAGDILEILLEAPEGEFVPTPCYDCGEVEIEYYMLKDRVWALAFPEFDVLPVRHPRIRPSVGFQLCFGCLEKRLKRPLVEDDLAEVPLNHMMGWFEKIAHRRCQSHPESPNDPPRHALKTWPDHFAAVVSGAKTFEARLDDRGFEVGHYLDLCEYDPDEDASSGRVVTVRVTHLLRGPAFGVAEGHVVMSIQQVGTFDLGRRSVTDAVRAALSSLQADPRQKGPRPPRTPWSIELANLLEALEAIPGVSPSHERTPERAKDEHD